MNIQQVSWHPTGGWDMRSNFQADSNLVLVFADSDYFYQDQCYQELRSFYPQADIVGCSSAGNIRNLKISDNDITVLAIKLNKSWMKSVVIEVDHEHQLPKALQEGLSKLPREHLRHCFVVTDGLDINATDLAQSLSLSIQSITITGGLAGDGDRFTKTGVMFNSPAKFNQVVIIGFYGPLHITTGFSTGWTEFGAERRVTRSNKNTVYELDHEPALKVYERYLGELAKQLPSSGLRFPLSIRRTEKEAPIIRTLLGVNTEENSLTFAGDIPEGSYARLMKTNIDSLLDSTQEKISSIKQSHPANQGLCLIVSCVGRRLVLDQISEEEIELISTELGDGFKLSGFYSYGEFASYNLESCQLHNQTATITLLSEDE